MSSIALFIFFKIGLVAAVLALAFRELRIIRRPDANPEFTKKLVHIFSAADRVQQQRTARPAVSPAAEPAAEPPAEPEPLRRAA